MSIKKKENKIGIFIDGANIYYGLDGKRIDFEDFKEWIANGRKIVNACYFNASQKENSPMQKFFNHVKKCGFKVYVKQTTKNSATNQWKQEGIDVYLTVKAMKYMKNYDTFILISGDFDYVPLVDELVKSGKKIEIISFRKSLHPIYERWPVRYMDDYVKEIKEKEEPEKVEEKEK